MKKSAQKHKNKTKWLVPGATVFLAVVLGIVAVSLKHRPSSTFVAKPVNTTPITASENIILPKPDLRSSNSIEAVLNSRRTRRDFLDKNLSLKQVSQMLWAAQGVTVSWGGRTVPSAKSVYPLTIYLLANKVDGLDSGEYQYIPGDREPIHGLKPIKKVDWGNSLYSSLNESSFKNAPAVLVVTGNMTKMAEAYGGVHHDSDVYLESGHVGQNLYLQAESLGLGLVVVSSFNENALKTLITTPSNETLIYLVPFGYPKE